MNWGNEWLAHGRREATGTGSSNTYCQLGTFILLFLFFALFSKHKGFLLPPILLAFGTIHLPLPHNEVGQLIFLGTILIKSTQLKISACNLNFVSNFYGISLGQGEPSVCI